MINDQPNAADLLLEARREFIESILPNIASESRYKAAMVLRAMELAERELASDRDAARKLVAQLRQLLVTDKPESALSGMLSGQLREGKFDSSQNLYELLQLAVIFKLRVTGPLKLSADLENRLNNL